MNDNKYKIWDLVIKIIAGIGSVGAFFYGIYQYNQNNDRAFRQELYKLHNEIFNKLIDEASFITSTDKDSSDSKLFQLHYNNLYRLYSGPLKFVNDSNLTKSVKKFLDNCEIYRIKTSPITQSQIASNLDSIAIFCSIELQKTWNVNIAGLINKK